MHHVAYANITYRYQPFLVDNPDSSELWDEGGYAPVNLDTAVPVPAQARALNWARILQHIDSADQDEIRGFILKHHLDLFIDGDHKVASVDGVLRFHAKSYDRMLCDSEVVNLNTLSVKRQQGKITLAVYRRFHRNIGYSLCGFQDLSHMGAHASFTRKLTKKGNVCKAHCPIWLLQ